MIYFLDLQNQLVKLCSLPANIFPSIFENLAGKEAGL